MDVIKTVYVGNLNVETKQEVSGALIRTNPASMNEEGKYVDFSPTDLFAVSLASCMLTMMGFAARTHGFSIDGTRAETQEIISKNPHRVTEFIVDLYLPANNYSDHDKLLIESAVKTCPVGNSLHPDIKKTINFHY